VVAKIIIFLRQKAGEKQESFLKYAYTFILIIWACLSGRAIHFSPRRPGCSAMWRQRAPLLPPQPSQAPPAAGCRSYPSCGGNGN